MQGRGPPGRAAPRPAYGRRRPRSLRDPVERLLEVAGQVAGRSVAVGRILAEAALDDPAQRRRRGGIELGDRLGFLADDGRERLDRGLLLEGAPAGGHLVENRAERELVGAKVRGLAARLFRRHVADRPENHARARAGAGECRELRARVLRRDRELRETEVEDLREAVLVHHDVFGLQVPMDDPDLVGLGEALGDLRRDREEAAQRQRPRGEELAQRLSLDQLHRDEERAVRLADVVDGQDVRVIQRGGRAGLLLEARAGLAIAGDVGGKDLDGDLPAEPGVASEVDLPHSSGAERGADLVGTEPASGGQRHRG